MSLATTLSVCALALQAPQYTLSFDGSEFTLHSSSGVEHYPLNNPEAVQKVVQAFRKDDEYAVWDSRGLTVRKGAAVSTFGLEDAPVDPRFSTASEIDQTRRDVQAGLRSLRANGLSGSCRIGQRTLFLLRWSDTAGKPWFEALVEVDLDSPKLQPILLGRLAGLTGCRDAVGDRLFLTGGGVAAITQRDMEWGISSYSFATRGFDFVSEGAYLDRSYRSGLYEQTTPYRTVVGGQILSSGSSNRVLFESRLATRWLDGDVPPVAILTGASAQILRNCDTGQEQLMGASARFKRTSVGVLAWSPPSQPQHAVLLSFDRWKRIAAWNKR